ncbi:MAG: CotH kinase family protein [Clostridia bacterium]|nr:CotH kinase family protein [Clostridia bacterium]
MKKRIALVFVWTLAVICIIGLVGGGITWFHYRKSTKVCEQERAIPRIDIDTFGAEIVSKEDYVDCTVSISGTEIDQYTAGIRGRGNSTWAHPKKPYRIKFDEKVSLFGEAKNKSWVLLALYSDFSAVKDRLAFGMADALQTDVFVPSYHYVELYINGKYNGLYLLTDQVDENAGRTGVKEDFTAEDVEVPFLVELDAYAPDEGEEGVDWFRTDSGAYAIKYPEADERYTAEQFEYIKKYITDVDNACKEGSLEKLSALVDIDSFIDYYIVQETMGQPEINWKSVYMYKTKSGPMKMGPIWDFDWSAIGPSTGKTRNAYRDRIEGFHSVNNWFDLMIKNSPEFKALAGERFDEVKETLLSVIENLRNEQEILDPYYNRNHLHWQWFRFWENHGDYYQEVLDWCVARIEWMDTAL